MTILERIISERAEKRNDIIEIGEDESELCETWRLGAVKGWRCINSLDWVVSPLLRSKVR